MIEEDLEAKKMGEYIQKDSILSLNALDTQAIPQTLVVGGADSGETDPYAGFVTSLTREQRAILLELLAPPQV